MKKIFVSICLMLLVTTTAALAQNPPTNLNGAYNYNDNDQRVTLNWTPPDVSVFWLHWNKVEPDTGQKIGLQNGGALTIAARFDTTDMSRYVGGKITHLKFRFTDILGINGVAIRVWEGGSKTGPGALILTQTLTGYQENVWKEWELTTPITVKPGLEYWVGCGINHNAGARPATADIGPMIPDKGGWFSTNGGISWGQLKANAGIDRNWHIQAKVKMTSGVVLWQPNRPTIDMDDYMAAIKTPPILTSELSAAPNPPSPAIREASGLTAYRLYRSRNSVINLATDAYKNISDPTATQYIDKNNGSGYEYDKTYYYALLARYDTGDSVLSNTAAVLVNSPARIELAYDDSVPDVDVRIDGSGGGMAVRFVSTHNVHAKLMKARFRMGAQYPANMNSFAPFDVHVYNMAGTNPGTDKTPPITVTPTVTVTPDAWYEVDLLPAKIIIGPTESFCIGFIQRDVANRFAADLSLPRSGRTLFWDRTAWSEINDQNMMIRAVLYDSSRVHPDAIEDEIVLTPETAFSVASNYPNPFYAATTLEYNLPERTDVSVRVYNSVGQFVRELVKTTQDAGLHQTEWDGRNERGAPVSDGIYLYEVRAGQQREQRRMLLLR